MISLFFWNKKNLPTRRFSIFTFLNGAKEKNRTSDTRIFSPLLYHWATLALNMVGVGGLEPPTSSLSEMRSNQLSYTPMFYQCKIYYTNLSSNFKRFLKILLFLVMKVIIERVLFLLIKTKLCRFWVLINQVLCNLYHHKSFLINRKTY